MFLPNIHVVIRSCPTIEEANEYYDFVDKTLAIHDGMPNQRFILHCKLDYDLKRVYDWLRIVVQCGVQVLGLKFCCDCNGRDPPERYILDTTTRFFPWDKSLAIHDGMPIQRFILHCKVDYDLKRVYDWLRIVVQCGVQVLGLKFCCNCNGRDPPERYILDPTTRFFPWQNLWETPWTFKTLVELNLEGEYELDVPKDEVHFPSMKKIRLVEKLCFMRHSDDLRRINVSSTSLKRLRIHTDAASVVYFECKVTIDAPNLVYLYIMDEVQSDYSFTVKPLFLVEAYIHSITIYGDQILTNISAAKVLTLTSSTSAFDEVDEVFDKFYEIDEFDKINEEVILFYNGLEVLARQILDSKGAIPSKTVADAKVTIQEMTEHSQKWHNETSRTRSTKTSDGLAVIQAQFNNLGREIKKVNEKVYAAQVGCEQCKGPYYTKDCPLKKEDAAIRNQGASIKTLEIQIGKISKVLQERGIGSLSSSTEANPRDNVKSILTTDEADTNLIRRASVCVMPLSTFLNLGLGELAHTKLTFELAYRTVKYLKGIAKNVLVGIGKIFFPVDFVILDMPEDVKVPLILGRLFLSTAHAMIDVFKRTITLRVGDEKIIFKSVKPASSLIKRVFMLGLRERIELDLEARLMGETFNLNGSLDPLYGDYIKLNDLNVPFELKRYQVDDLIPTIEEGEVIDEHMIDIIKTRNNKQEEKQIEEEQAAKAQNSKIPVCYDDDDDYNSTITPYEPVDSLSIGDEHLNTISATELDEFIKSYVENLVPNPSESEGKNGCDVPACFTTFSNILFDVECEFESVDYQSCSDEDFLKEIFSNPLFEEEIIPMKINPHHFNAESDLIESLLNRDYAIISSSLKINSLLDEFAGELTLLKSIQPRINKTDCYPEEDIRLTKRLLYDNSSPRLPEEFVSENSNAEIESFSPSPIPNEDNDYHMEEIDLCLTPNDPMPPRIEDDDDHSERDILILKELLDNYSLSLPEIKSYHFDILSFFRPPAKLPDGNMGILNIKMMGDNSEQKVPILGLMINLVSNQEKSPDLLSHRGLENFQLSAKGLMMIHEKNIHMLDVPISHFYPLDQFKYGGNWVKLSDLKQALRGRHPCLSVV
nr:hypothetical protein [Tanacetum cinerariifolium]